MALERPIVLATRNPGKINEFRALLTGFDVEVRGLHDFAPIPEVLEDGATFEQNARKKAVQTARELGFPTLADDSGLVVEALGGDPGVRSARYAGDGSADHENNRKLLKAMIGVKNRSAAFECVICIAVPNGQSLSYKGRCEGEIALRPVGTKGFGYDPVFFYPPLNKTFAELAAEEKNTVSHRGKAMDQVRKDFKNVLLWIERMLDAKPR